MSDWKPGDVALIKTAAGGDDECRAVRTATRNWRCSHGTSAPEHVTSVRPLVVIDAEDREQVERLAEQLRLHFGDANGVTSALREFANPKPPRPEEPTGWGAVVEDNTGAYWTLYAPEARAWINYREGKRRWHEIAAVRLVSEGVVER